MDMYMRRKCQECRLKKCLAVGMRPECVVPENQCAIKRKEKKAQKEKDKGTGSISSNSSIGGGSTLINSSSSPIKSSLDAFKTEILPQLMKCEPPPHSMHQLLPEKLLQDNRNKNLPQLSPNQMSVIYKLIWYQDGYEQPSEEDIKRISAVSYTVDIKSAKGSYQPLLSFKDVDDEEDKRDAHFRYITEITILTVQLIVEFAKGLPAFTKIPQEDQITLLKVKRCRRREISNGHFHFSFSWLFPGMFQ